MIVHINYKSVKPKPKPKMTLKDVFYKQSNNKQSNNIKQKKIDSKISKKVKKKKY
tara:strand:- start:3174 stop:3338 length:165 start_codon:yes stop_codon:yes gene_type:complete